MFKPPPTPGVPINPLDLAMFVLDEVVVAVDAAGPPAAGDHEGTGAVARKWPGDWLGPAADAADQRAYIDLARRGLFEALERLPLEAGLGQVAVSEASAHDCAVAKLGAKLGQCAVGGAQIAALGGGDEHPDLLLARPAGVGGQLDLDDARAQLQ